MTYDQLRAFLAVAAEGSFTDASLLLHKSQPAVSKLVKNLEGELGLELLDRSGYRVTLTDAGRLLNERAASLIEGTEALRGFAQALAGRIEPIVRIAVDAVTPLAPLLDVVRAAQERHPAVRFELSTESLAGAGNALRDRRADLVLGTALGVDRAAVEMARFRSVRIVPVARRDHPLARSRAAATGALLRAHPQIVLRDSGGDPRAPSLNVLAGGLRWTVGDVAAKKEVILAGMGWGGLPEHVAGDALASGELVALDVPEFETEAMELFAMRRRDVAHGVVASELWDALRRDGATVGRIATRAARRARRRRPAGGRPAKPRSAVRR